MRRSASTRWIRSASSGSASSGESSSCSFSSSICVCQSWRSSPGSGVDMGPTCRAADGTKPGNAARDARVRPATIFEVTETKELIDHVSTLLLVPLDDVVVFPNMTIHLDADLGDEELVLLVPKQKGEYESVGTVAQVVERNRRGALVTGLHRGTAGVATADADGRLRVEVDEHEDVTPPRIKTAELESEYRAVVEEILELRNADERVSAFLRSV